MGVARRPEGPTLSPPRTGPLCGGDVDQGPGDHGRKANTKIFKIRALRAPMFDSRTGKKYSELRLVPGRVYTFGRCRSSCDVVFSDARVSRQHCQIYWGNITNKLFLFEGAPVDSLTANGNVTMSSSSPSVLAPGKIKPSLNGLYVNGKSLEHGGCCILKKGSEVSLIARTKGAKTVDDPGFGNAIGFFVELVDLCQLNNSLSLLYRPTEADVKNIWNPKSGLSEKGGPLLPAYCRKGPLVNCIQGTRGPTDDKNSVSFECRSSFSSTARVEKKRDRSTTEIMGLLRQEEEASSGLMKVNDQGLDAGNKTLDDQRLDEGSNILRDQRLDKGNKILRGSERNLDNVELSGKCARKTSSRSNSTCQDTEMLLEGSSRSRVVDGEAIPPALARTSLTKPRKTDIFRGNPDLEVETEPEYGCFKVGPGMKAHFAEQVMDQACSLGEVERNRGTPEALERNVMEMVQENISNADAGVLNGKYSRPGFLLNRLKDTEPPNSQVPSQQTVSLEELLNPIDGLLGIFVATFTSDILWFLSSHNISPELPVTVACHDHVRCWSTAEESRTSSPFPSWPNVKVVYPSFPDSCCFATEKRQGIGCHHPKIFLLPRKNSIRVIVTSANLNSSQWLHVTNSVWWQDFPRKALRDYDTLFCPSGMDETRLISKQTQNDFAMHLASFVASLVADVPSAAHWALDLAEFDFSDAAASLVTSIPGLYGCPCPAVPNSIRDLLKRDLLTAENSAGRPRKFLAAVNSTVVGVSHRFKDSADPCGKRVRALAAVLNNSNLEEYGWLKVRLERVTNLTADPNAVSVIVSSDATQGGMEMLIGKDLLQATGDSLSSTPRNSVHVGFLPRTVAKWVAPLYDNGLCTFTALIQPNEVIGLASGTTKKVAQLVLYVFEGRTFSHLSASDPPLQHTVALCSLLRNMERPLGLWRLHQVLVLEELFQARVSNILSKFNWLDAAETHFVFGSSSVGTSLDASFLAAFSVAAGKKAICSVSSEESDSQWGAWTTGHEANAPSIGVVFPTIERVKAAKGGPLRHQGIYCFAESTWERLKTACLLHDAVPFPAEREGIPMHVKVAQRRFQNHPREAPYGWVYCGSHNFSPAAWGRPHAKAIHPCKCRKTTLGCTLFISNYEVGLIFVEPPPNGSQRISQFKALARKPNLDESEMESDVDNKRLGLDKFLLPFCVPAPKYSDSDQPATRRAIYSAVENWRSEQLLPDIGLIEDSDAEMASSAADNEGDDSRLCLDSETNSHLEEEYGGLLWSQIDPFVQ